MAEEMKIKTRATEIALCVGKRVVSYVTRGPGDERCKLVIEARATDADPLAIGSSMRFTLAEWDAYAAAVRAAIVELEGEPEVVDAEMPAALPPDVLLALGKPADALWAEGWRPWAGGHPMGPVRPSDRVEVVLRSGKGTDDIEASFLRWEHRGNRDDIVAYRVVKGA